MNALQKHIREPHAKDSAPIVQLTDRFREEGFLAYFQEDTEIYQGMKVIDQQLGGTTPLDLIVQLENSEIDKPQQETESTNVE